MAVAIKVIWGGGVEIHYQIFADFVSAFIDTVAYESEIAPSATVVKFQPVGSGPLKSCLGIFNILILPKYIENLNFTKPNIAIICGISHRRVKGTKIWHSAGKLVRHILGTFNLAMFKVILESLTELALLRFPSTVVILFKATFYKRSLS